MMLRTDKKNIILYIGVLIASSLSLIIGNPLIEFLISLALFTLILKKGKYSFFSVFSFIMVFSYLQAVIQKTTGLASGTLRWTGSTMPLYFMEISVATIALLLTILFFVLFTNTVKNEKELYRMGAGISLFAGICFALVAVVLVLLLFPSFPSLHMDDSTRRTQGITQYYGFLLLALNLLSLTFDLSFSYKLFYLPYGFVLFWVLGHAERVEILGFIILFVLTYLNRLEFSELKKRIIKHKKMVIYGCLFVAFAVMMYIGMTRMGTYEEVTLYTLFYNLLVQPTCGDVVYVFNCAVNMWKEGNGLLGHSYIDYPLQLIPGSTPKFQIAAIMLQNYTVMGGGLFFTEPMANFGLIGTVLSNIEFCLVYSFILKKPSTFKVFFWTPLVIEIFRTAWYGRDGWILSSFVIMPIMYIVSKCFLNKVKI